MSRVREVFQAFLFLGLTAYGGPVAHLAYFRSEFVDRRRWISEQAYADLVALCQFLPGPASSQVGFALGLMRAGPWGAVAAWTAFTLPSAIILVLFALGAGLFQGPISEGVIHGLKITAVAVVAHAVLAMARSLCPDLQRASIAMAALFIAILMTGPFGQVTAIVAGAGAGLLLCRRPNFTPPAQWVYPLSAKTSWIAGSAFVLLLMGLPLLSWMTLSHTLDIADAFYRSGSLVFGGGHVVLPLLEAEMVQSDWISAEAFLAGYGAAQAVPGPLFTFAAYLGALLAPANSWLLGVTIALLMIFLPGLLLLIAVLPYWQQLQQWRLAQAMMRGANAAVVGILAAALYHPVWTSGIGSPWDFALALAGFVLLQTGRAPAWLVVILLAAGGIFITL